MGVKSRISVKIILFKGKTNADGTHSIMLEHYIDGKATRKVIHRCKPDQWDQANRRVKGKVSNSAYINHLISEAYSEAEMKVLMVKTGDKTVQSLFEAAKPITLEEAFDQEMERLKRDLKNGPYERIATYKKQMSAFCKIENLRLSDIDLAWFEKFTTHMRYLGNCGATNQKKVKTLRALVQRYSDTQLSMDIANYRVAIQRPVKQKLTMEEFKSIEQLDLTEGTSLCWARDFFVLQVYLRGSRVGVLLQAYSGQFVDGRYNASNDDGGKNNISCALLPPAQDIVNKYIGKYERLFPFFKWSPAKKLSDFDNKAVSETGGQGSLYRHH